MSIHRKLRAWEQAGVIDAATRARIQTYEESRTRPWALYVVGGLGALAVVLGVISMVAANWDDIPGRLKIAVDLAAMGALAWGVLRADDQDAPWPREVLLLLFFGMALASVGLIGQVYNLGGAVWMALLAWSLMTLPALLLLGGSAVSAVAMLGALNGSLVTSLVEWLDHAHLDTFWEHFLAFSVFGMLPLVHIALSHLEGLQRWRPWVARVAGNAGWTAVLAGSAVLMHGWYEHHTLEDAAQSALLAACVPVLATAAWVFWDLARVMANAPPTALTAWRVVLVYAVATGLLPWLVNHDRVGVLAGVSFVGFCGILAWAAYHRGNIWLFNLASTVLGLRLLAVFVELFGGLLLTGFGLVASGLLTLAAARLWMLKTREFRSAMRTHGGSP